MREALRASPHLCLVFIFLFVCNSSIDCRYSLSGGGLPSKNIRITISNVNTTESHPAKETQEISTMPSLETFPPELIGMIFKCLADMDMPDNRVPVAPLVSTCRRFHQILTPMLYYSVGLNALHNGEKCLGVFFRTIRDNDSLAHHVRYVHIVKHDSTTGFEDNAEGIARHWKEGEEWLKYALPRVEIREKQAGGGGEFLRNGTQVH